jgi:hypothetical protein
MARTLVIALSFLPLLAACARHDATGSDPGESVAVLRLDDEHNHANAKSALVYKLPVAGAIALDPSGLGLAARANPQGPPDTVQIAMKRGTFATQWDGQSRIILSRDTLRPLAASSQFAGFRAGDRCALAIGHSARPDQLNVIWATLIEIE